MLSCIALFCLYLPWSPAGLVWPHEWLIVGAMALCGVLVWWRQRRHFVQSHDPAISLEDAVPVARQ